MFFGRRFEFFGAEIQKGKTVFGLHRHERIACPALQGAPFLEPLTWPAPRTLPEAILHTFDAFQVPFWIPGATLGGTLRHPFFRHFFRDPQGPGIQSSGQVEVILRSGGPNCRSTISQKPIAKSQ